MDNIDEVTRKTELDQFYNQSVVPDTVELLPDDEEYSSRVTSPFHHVDNVLNTTAMPPPEDVLETGDKIGIILVELQSGRRNDF